VATTTTTTPYLTYISLPLCPSPLSTPSLYSPFFTPLSLLPSIYSLLSTPLSLLPSFYNTAQRFYDYCDAASASVPCFFHPKLTPTASTPPLSSFPSPLFCPTSTIVNHNPNPVVVIFVLEAICCCCCVAICCLLFA